MCSLSLHPLLLPLLHPFKLGTSLDLGCGPILLLTMNNELLRLGGNVGQMRRTSHAAGGAMGDLQG